MTRVQTAMPLDASRYLPISLVADKLALLHNSGAVDYVHFWDQMMGWWPRHMWTPENSPLAQFVGDIDSQPDAFALAAYGLAKVPEMGVSVSTDAIRRGPAEMMQSLLTLGQIAARPMVLQLGAGEVRNVKPYGWKRAQGLKRLEDHFRFYDAYRHTDGPIDLEGNFWNYDQAWIGRGGDADALRLWALGGGPKLLDIATSYADGITSLTPGVWTTPEQTAERVGAIKEQLESKNRDPEQFDFALWGACLIHEDETVIERALNNTTVRWLAAIVGRFTQNDWLEAGCEPPVARDWHYATKFLPLLPGIRPRPRRCSTGCPQTWCARRSSAARRRRSHRRSARHVQAGITWVEVADMLPFVLEPEQAAAAVGRSIRVCQLIKGEPVAAGADAAPAQAS